jgi:hypothetical protein
MTRDDLEAWLEARRPAPPEALAARLRSLATDSPLALPEHLAALGRDVLRRVSAGPAADRTLALDLLAADALVTYAFEAQAEADVHNLGTLAVAVARDA